MMPTQVGAGCDVSDGMSLVDGESLEVALCLPPLIVETTDVRALGTFGDVCDEYLENTEVALSKHFHRPVGEIGDKSGKAEFLRDIPDEFTKTDTLNLTRNNAVYFRHSVYAVYCTTQTRVRRRTRDTRCPQRKNVAL